MEESKSEDAQREVAMSDLIGGDVIKTILRACSLEPMTEPTVHALALS